jgi:hypothetical protein
MQMHEPVAYSREGGSWGLTPPIGRIIFKLFQIIDYNLVVYTSLPVLRLSSWIGARP